MWELRTSLRTPLPLGTPSTSTAFRPGAARRPALEPQSEAKSESGSGTFTVRVGSTIAEVERRLILATLREYQEDKPKSASVLGISLKTLYNRLNQYQAPDGQQSGPDEQGQARANEVEVVP